MFRDTWTLAADDAGECVHKFAGVNLSWSKFLSNDLFVHVLDIQREWVGCQYARMGECVGSDVADVGTSLWCWQERSVIAFRDTGRMSLDWCIVACTCWRVVDDRRLQQDFVWMASWWAVNVTVSRRHRLQLWYVNYTITAY